MYKRGHRNGDSPANKKVCEPSDYSSDDDMFNSPLHRSQMGTQNSALPTDQSQLLSMASDSSTDRSQLFPMASASPDQSQFMPTSFSPVPLDSQISLPANYSLSGEKAVSTSGITQERAESLPGHTPDNITPQDELPSIGQLLDQSFDNIEDPDVLLENAINQSKEKYGLESTAETLLRDKELKSMLIYKLNSRSHDELRYSLSHSQLSRDKKKRDRDYLLSITPKSICQEFQENAPEAFELLLHGLMGVTETEALYKDCKLMNRVALVLSTIATYINRKATGYAMVLTSAARDGGLREDSLKLLVNLVHPSTMQRYDRKVLAKDWDQAKKKALNEEKQHFIELNSGKLSIMMFYLSGLTCK